MAIFHRLKNPLRLPFHIESPHLAQVHCAESTAKLASKVTSESFDQFFSILGSFHAALLEFDDPTPDLPIGCRHQGIDCCFAHYVAHFWANYLSHRLQIECEKCVGSAQSCQESGAPDATLRPSRGARSDSVPDNPNKSRPTN